MKAISKALLNLASFIELSPESQVDDAAIKALEQLASDLSEYSW